MRHHHFHHTSSDLGHGQSGKQHFMRRGQRGHGFDRGGFEGEDRGGRRRVFDSAELRLVLLKLLQDQPRHGYELIRAIEELTQGGYSPSPGIVYPTLTMLNDMGHIREESSDAPKRVFAITREGEAFLGSRKAEADALIARLSEMGARRGHVEGAQIRRAMGNLKAVLMHRLGQDDVKPETIHAVTSILDEAAQKIERL